MKNKIKKILTSTIISAVSVTAIGCSTTNSKLAKTIDKGMAEFVSSINNLDYVETTAKASTNDNLGKIVEASLATNKYANNYFSADVSPLNIENTITKPSERNDDFKLYVLSESPYVTLTSDNNATTLNMFVKFSTNKIEETSEEIDTKINSLILKRSILMIYVNEIYSGNINLSEENKVAINAYVNVIKENASFLNGNRGMVKNQLSLANDLINNESNENLVNYYIIKSGEALETRSNKIDSTISAIDSIIEILENNLTSNSPYYQSQLSNTYESFIQNINSSNTSSSENKELADNIVNSLNLTIAKNESSNTNSTNSQNNITNNQQNTTITNNTTNSQTLPTRHINDSNVRNLDINQNSNLNQNLSINDTNNNQYKNQENKSRTTNNTNSTNNINQNYTQNNFTNNTNNTINKTGSRRRITRNNPSNQNTNSTNNNSQINPNQLNNSARNLNRTNSHNTNTNDSVINSNINDENSQNKAKEISNMDNKTKIVRADRTREKQQEEQYTSSRTNSMVNERAERVPYKSTTTFNQ